MERREYAQLLGPRDTQRGIKLVKDTFERELAAALNLERVTAPLFVLPETGLNDNLSGWEQPVSFQIRQMGKQAQIVQSLAKWKRYALGQYGYQPGEGLYTDMNAIRPDDTIDAIHSIYVDQWDWERVLTQEERNVETLKQTVRRIYACLRSTRAHLLAVYPQVADDTLPSEPVFVTSQELLDLYGDIPPEEREYRFVKEHGACFIIGIGGRLSDGKPHGTRSPDYDDWALNGDLIVYYEPLDIAMELTSMGIRVDAASMGTQLEIAGEMGRADLPFHRAVLDGELPLTIGGGIGQSRLCMLLLRKTHIGQVSVSVWPEQERENARRDGGNVL